MLQREYSVVARGGGPDNPLLEWDDDSEFAFLKGTFVPLTAPIKLRLGEPVPRNPVMVDCHSLPAPVVSQRIKDVLEKLNLFGLQLAPAEVTVRKGEILPYWLVHVYNEIACMDKKLSLFDVPPDDQILFIDKLSLDDQILQKIPIDRRLLFYLAENTSVLLCHESVVEKVLALKPEGIRFVPVDQWSTATLFQP